MNQIDFELVLILKTKWPDFSSFYAIKKMPPATSTMSHKNIPPPYSIHTISLNYFKYKWTPISFAKYPKFRTEISTFRSFLCKNKNQPPYIIPSSPPPTDALSSSNRISKALHTDTRQRDRCALLASHYNPFAPNQTAR